MRTSATAVRAQSVANPALAPANGALAKAGLEPSEATWWLLLTPGSVVAKLPLLTCGGRGAPGREEEHRRGLGSLQPGSRCGGSWSQTSRLGGRSPCRLFPSRKGGNSEQKRLKTDSGGNRTHVPLPPLQEVRETTEKRQSGFHGNAHSQFPTFQLCRQESEQGPSDPSVAGQWPLGRFRGGGPLPPPSRTP